MTEKKWSDKHYEVLNAIPRDRGKAIQSRALIRKCGLTFRRLKEIITDLREEYPIVAKETHGGGYWIAQSKDEVQDYMDMIGRRRDGYQDTINTMAHHLWPQERISI